MIGKKEKYTIIKPEVKIIKIIKQDDPKLFKAFVKHAQDCDTASGLIRQAEDNKEDLSDKIENVKPFGNMEYVSNKNEAKTGAYFSGKNTLAMGESKSSFEYHKPGIMTCGCGQEVGKDNTSINTKTESKNVYGVATGSSNETYGNTSSKSQKKYN